MYEEQNAVEAVDELFTLHIYAKIRQLLETYEATETIHTPEELAEKVKSELGINDEDLSNFTLIEAINVLNQRAYEYVRQDKRVLLIPHCLRDAERCRAPIDDEGYHCKKCGACVIADITRAAEERGIKWYMVGGGSHAIQIVKNARPRAVFGIACFDDAKLAFDRIEKFGIPTQAVLLSKAGCVNTEVDLDRVIAKLNIPDSTNSSELNQK